MRFDFEEKKASSAIEEVAGFAISGDGKYLIISKVDGSLVTASVDPDMEPENSISADCGYQCSRGRNGHRYSMKPGEWRANFSMPETCTV